MANVERKFTIDLGPLGRRPWWILIAVLGLVLSSTVIGAPYVHVLIVSPRLVAHDFRVFYAGGRAVAMGADPYRVGSLRAAGYRGSLLFPDLPWVALVFAPLSVLPLMVAYGVWCLFIALLIGGAMYAWARALGYGSSAWAAALFTLSGAAIFNYELGQTSALVLAALVGTVVSAQRRRFILAGALSMMAALAKPQDAWVVVPLLLAATWRASDRRWLPVLIGQASGAALLLLGPMAVNAGLLFDWIRFILEFARIPNPASIYSVGLYGLLSLVPLSGAVRVVLGHYAFTVLPSAGVLLTSGTVLWVRRRRHFAKLAWDRQVAWLLLLPMLTWLLLTPYAGGEDLISCLPLALLVTTTPNARLGQICGWIALWGVLVIPELVVITSNTIFPPVSIAGFGLLILGACAVRGILSEQLAPKASVCLPTKVSIT